MSQIKSSGTRPEAAVRSYLHRLGFRFRKNDKRLAGSPDVFFPRYYAVLFVNGCFWHGHFVEIDKMENTVCCKIPMTNHDFWVAKIRRNKERDKEKQRKLAEMGWHCITIWECELKARVREQTLDSLAFTLNHIWLQDHSLRNVAYSAIEEESDSLLIAAEE